MVSYRCSARLVMITLRYSLLCSLLSHAIAPRYKAFSQKYTNVVFTECDVDKAQEVAAKYSVSAMPTFIFLKKGVKVDQVRGADPNGLEAAIKRHSSDTGTSSFSGKGQTLGGASVPQEIPGGAAFDFGAFANLDPQMKILLFLVGM